MKNINGISCVIGAIMLALGITSPAISTKVNAEASTLVFCGLLLVVVGLWSDHIQHLKERSRRRR